MTFSLSGDRRVRGGKLRVSPVLYPLFGLPRPAGKLDLGRARGVSRTVLFDELPANVWSGVVRYRWTRGRRTLAFGAVRTQTRRVGRRRGRGSCTLSIGRRPEDRLAPAVFLTPETPDWLRGPVEVRFLAFDDLSGVHSVTRQVDGGPPSSGRSLVLASEGAHSVAYSARDVAGNVSAQRQATVRVDGGPPSTPSVSLPLSVTGDTTPLVGWSAATDTGSGVRSYVVTVADTAGNVLRTRSVGGSTTSVTIDDALPAGTYDAQVHAVDGTAPEPYVSTSAPRRFEVRPGPPQVTGTSPAAGAVIPLGSAASDVTLSFDRPMDASSLGSSLALTRVRPGGGAQPSSVTVSCSGECTTATLRPGAALPEGVYEIKATTGARSADGDPLPSEFAARFSVPMVDESFTTCVGWNAPDWECTSSSPLGSQVLGTVLSNRPLAGQSSSASIEDPVAHAFTAGEVVRTSFRRHHDRNATCDDSATFTLKLGIQTADAGQITAGTATHSFETALDGSGQRAVDFEATLDLAPRVGSCTALASKLFFDDLLIARKPQ